MKKSALLAIPLLLLLLGLPRFAQSQLLGLSAINITGIPDTVQYGDTLKNIMVTVKNTGLLPLSSILINVRGTVNNTGLVNGLLGGLFLPLNLPLLVGNQVPIQLNHYVVTPQNSNSGTNVVVIWPSAPGVTPEDSASETYYVKDDAGAVLQAEPTETMPKITLYPNPAGEFVALRVEGHREEVAEMAIYDSQGRTMLRLMGWQDRISLKALPAGLYFIELSFRDGQVATKKFAHQ